MNAFNTVNLAAACVLTSTEYAEKLGIPKDRWIFPLGGAGTQDSPNCERLISPAPLLHANQGIHAQSGIDQTFILAPRCPDPSIPLWK